MATCTPRTSSLHILATMSCGMLLRRRLPLMLHERAQQLSAVDTEAEREADEAEAEGEPGEVRDTSQWFVSKFISSSSRGAGSFDVSFRSVRTLRRAGYTNYYGTTRSTAHGSGHENCISGLNIVCPTCLRVVHRRSGRDGCEPR